MEYAVAYERVSTKVQSNGYQTFATDNWLSEHPEVILKKRFSDVYSGFDPERPGISNLKRYINENCLDRSDEPITMLLVYSMDRLTRNIEEADELLTKLPSMNIKLLFIGSKQTYKGDMIQKMYILEALKYSNSMVDRNQRYSKAGYDRAVKEGKIQGKSYTPGCDLDINEILAMSKKGMTMEAIANYYGCAHATIRRKLIRENKLELFKENQKLAKTGAIIDG